MTKEAKKMNYAINVTKTIKLTDGIIDGMNKKKAKALKGTWIKLNPATFALVEESNLTVVGIVKDEIGCACDGFTKADTPWMCEHLIAFKDLKNDPQVSIQSPEYRWLQAYLFGKGWSSEEDRWLYPSLDAPEPEVVAGLPPDEDSWKPDGEEEPAIDEKTYSRKCTHCGEIISDTDLAQVKLDIAEHIRGCPSNPVNKKKSPRPVTQEAPKPSGDVTVDEIDVPIVPKPTVVESAPVEKPSMYEDALKESGRDVPKEKKPPSEKEEKKVKPERKSTAVSTEVLMPSDAEFRDAKTERILQSQGGFYKVAGGKEVPDAAAVQAYAVGNARISTEVLKVEQDAKHVLVIVRCHRNDVYTDASVYIDFDTQRKRELLKVANKNPKSVRGWDDNGPVFDPDFKVVTEKKSVPLMVHLFNRMTDFAYFAPRTAESQAIRRAQAKMLGSEWRDAEEINTEAEEVTSVNQR